MSSCFLSFCHFLTCYFDYDNVNGSYVYKAGKPASSCGDWGTTKSKEFANLCYNNGNLIPAVSTSIFPTRLPHNNFFSTGSIGSLRAGGSQRQFGMFVYWDIICTGDRQFISFKIRSN